MRALYISHTGMTEALGRSQVLPYVRGLARAGWQIEIVAFEPANAVDADIARLRDELAGDRIGYHPSRRSPSHAIGRKLLEAGEALATLVACSLAARPRIVHARSYLPGAVAEVLAALSPGTRFLFDCRGLLGDEYADSGYWSRTSLRYRLLKKVERQLFARAGAVVTLTEKLRGWLRAERWVGETQPVEVVPCCVDLCRFKLDERARERARASLGADGRFVLAYSGNLGSWYCEEEMARLFAALRQLRPSLFAIFTRASSERLRAALRREGVPDREVVVSAVSADEMPSQLAAADAGISFAKPWFSKIASSPVKVAEYLAVGAPVVMNRGIGDGDELIDGGGPIIDAGALGPADLDAAAGALAALPTTAELRGRAHELARARFDLEEVGIARYRQLYERLA